MNQNYTAEKRYLDKVCDNPLIIFAKRSYKLLLALLAIILLILFEIFLGDNIITFRRMASDEINCEVTCTILGIDALEITRHNFKGLKDYKAEWDGKEWVKYTCEFQDNTYTFKIRTGNMFRRGNYEDPLYDFINNESMDACIIPEAECLPHLLIEYFLVISILILTFSSIMDMTKRKSKNHPPGSK